MNTLETLGKKIIAARRELGFRKRSEFAKEIDISEKFLQRYEQGKEPPPMKIISYICEQLKINPRAFIYGEFNKVNFRGAKKLYTSDKVKIAAIKDGIETLIEFGVAHYNRFDFIGNPNPEIAAREFIEHYNLNKNDFNTWEKVIKVLSERYIFVFAIPIKGNTSALIHEAEPFFIVLNSNEPIDRWSFSLLHEIGHLIAPSQIKGTDEEERYADIFAGSVLIPEEFRYSLWEKLRDCIKNRKYKTFFEKVRKLNDKVSPEAVFFTLIRDFEYDFGKFAQFRKKAKEIRDSERRTLKIKGKYFLPKRYKALIEDLYKNELITQARKEELLLKDFSE